MIEAAQTAFLVAAKPQRYAAMGAEFINQSEPAFTVAKRQQPLAERRQVVEWTAPRLPAGRPRYLMGVGTPLDLVHAVQHGIDLFDCVSPTRNARTHKAWTSRGRFLTARSPASVPSHSWPGCLTSPGKASAGGLAA